MDHIPLQATTRSEGKGIARRLRSSGHIPAVLYGRHQKPQHLAVNAYDFSKVTKQSPDLTAIIDLSIEGKAPTVALIRDYQAHTLTRAITHLDFQAIDLTKTIEIEVPLHLVGKPIGFEMGGVLEQLRRKIHIRVLPTKIPDAIEVDVSQLSIGQSIHADEVKLPAGVEFPHTTNYAIAALVPPTKEEAPPAPTVAAEGAEAAPAGEAALEGKEPTAQPEKTEKAPKGEPKGEKAKK